MIDANADLVADATRGCVRAALAYTIATAAVAAFGAVYEALSYEVYSPFMLYAFAVPLVLGVLPNLVQALRCGAACWDSRPRTLWACGVATLTVGSIFCGVLEIYGTTSPFVIVYPIVGVVLLVVAAIVSKGQTH